MVTKADLLMLGITAGVSGSLVGGVLLFVGLSLIVSGAMIGWVLFIPAAPLGALIGWLMARRLARQL